ncbi:MAG TPA: response regulator [Acetobacteraceae bacterium]|nr:response regulator [Acetobacteraceae bacterium]
MHDGRGRQVGVVDDDAAVCESLRFLLEAAGHVVVAFHSADEFLAAADSDKLDCLLLDHHMPQVTGLELLRRLRQDGRQVPVALMTGSPSAQLNQQALALGAVVVLEKPLAEQALFAFVEMLAP